MNELAIISLELFEKLLSILKNGLTFIGPWASRGKLPVLIYPYKFSLERKIDKEEKKKSLSCKALHLQLYNVHKISTALDSWEEGVIFLPCWALDFWTLGLPSSWALDLGLHGSMLISVLPMLSSTHSNAVLAHMAVRMLNLKTNSSHLQCFAPSTYRINHLSAGMNNSKNTDFFIFSNSFTF